MKKLTAIFAAALLLAACSGEKTPQVNYKLWYGWTERFLPDFSTLGEPDMQGTKINLDLEDLPDTANHFAVLFETVFNVKTAEEYTFKISSDDGTRFYVDGNLLIDNDGAHGPILKIATIPLSEGDHGFKLEFFDCDKGQSLDFTYSTPTIEERPLNNTLVARDDALSADSRFVKPQVKEAYKRFAAWKGKDEVLCFPMVTDIHTCNRFSYRHIGYAAQIAKKFGCDFMVNFGDFGLNAYPATVDSVYAQSIIDNVRSEMDKYKGIWLYTPGNHDFDGGAGRELDEAYLSAKFQQPWAKRAGENLHLEPGRAIFYYDVPAKGMRVIGLNSQGTCTRGGNYYIFDDAQLVWLQGVLDSTPENLAVMVLVHYTPIPLGHWTSYVQHPEQYRLENDARLMAMLSDYAKKGSVVGLFSGDSHFNFCVEEDGVHYFTSQGYGWCTSELLQPGTRRAEFDYRQTLCVDVVAVKPGKREVHTFRVGAGGAGFDSEYKY